MEIEPRQRLRIAYLCDFSPLEAHLYSGGNARLFDALTEHAGDVTILPNHWGLVEPLRRLVERLPEAINIRLRWRLHLLLAPIIARVVRKELKSSRYDVLFCAYSYQSLFRVRAPEGMVIAYTSDATPMVYKDSEIGQSFGSYLRLSRLIDPLIEATERQVFRSADLLFWPSNWLRGQAERRYDLDPRRSVKLPWGANIDRPEIDPDPPRLGEGPLRLLFVGRDWHAKGGSITLATLRNLQARGIDAELAIVGCDPPEAAGVRGVTVHDHLDKTVPEELARFQSLYRKSHFMVMPSFESFGFAFCEASAYGLPSLCLSIGGVPVGDGRNGHAFHLDADASEFADQIVEYLDRPKDYDALRQSTRAEYEQSLNWDVWGKSVGRLLRDAVENRRAGAPVSAVSVRSPGQPQQPSEA